MSRIYKASSSMIGCIAWRKGHSPYFFYRKRTPEKNMNYEEFVPVIVKILKIIHT